MGIFRQSMLAAATTRSMRNLSTRGSLGSKPNTAASSAMVSSSILVRALRAESTSDTSARNLR